ncbi:plasmid replication, integration and excision activator [Luteococcus sp.]|uniref:plasmid replication, integration and excision activator n=1 Tax=Luteococcus sp. TaxID=1969402 RepID=UPI0037366480
MAISRKLPVDNETLFPGGALLPSGEVPRPAVEFNAPKRPDGSKPQQIDPDTGLPLWQITVFDNDPTVHGKNKAVTVKIAARHQPVPPANPGNLPVIPVTFEGLTVGAYVEKNGEYSRVAWSIRATGFKETTQTTRDQGKAA